MQSKEDTINSKSAQGRKFIRYKEGAEIYGMSESSFQRLAKEACATYKLNKTVLVNTEILEGYLEQFRIY